MALRAASTACGRENYHGPQRLAIDESDVERLLLQIASWAEPR
jgi:hypothetical protein